MLFEKALKIFSCGASAHACVFVLVRVSFYFLFIYLFIYFLFALSGASEMLMANAVSQLAAKTPGKEAAAMEAFAAALRQVNTSSQ